MVFCSLLSTADTFDHSRRRSIGGKFDSARKTVVHNRPIFFFLTKQTYALHLLICDMDRYVLVLSFCQTDDGLAEDYKCKF